MVSGFSRKIVLLGLLIGVLFPKITNAQDEETPPRTSKAEDFNEKGLPSLQDIDGVKSPILAPEPLIVTIIESTSFHPGHTQDGIWEDVATEMGHSASIQPQTTLDNTDFFSTTDLLIISSGVIDIPLQRRAIIEQFIQQGGGAYIQSEYDCSYAANVTFASIVSNLGGSFSWIDTIEGDLIPMNVLGRLSNTPNIVPSLSSFWWGCKGSGNRTIQNYLEFNGDYFGFIFTPPNPNYGILITSSDQDWVRLATENQLLMENILTTLGRRARVYLPVIFR